MHGKNNEPLIIVDADALIAFVYTADANHQRAKHSMQQLAAMNSYLLFPTTAICEAVTVLRGRLNNPDDAARIVQKVTSGAFPLHAVEPETLQKAATF